VWVSLPSLAYARLADAAGLTIDRVRESRQRGEHVQKSLQELRDFARDRGMRFLLVTMPGGVVIADTEQEWSGSNVHFRQPSPPEQVSPAAQRVLRGRVRGPDGRVLFYLAMPVVRTPTAPERALYLVLTMGRWETAQPFIRPLLASVVLAGASAFVLSVPLALWLSYSLSTPLRQAAEAAERVAAGDYGVSLDVTSPDEARRLAESFNTMTRAVAASQRTQRDFVANVSHELKTPLTSIQGFAQAILDGTAADGPAMRRAAHIIHDETERLSRLVSKLLDLTRLESGETAMSWTNVDLVALARGCAEQFAPLADEHGIVIELDLDASAVVTGDGDRLVQVLTNLLDNALKHTDPGDRVVFLPGRQVALSTARRTPGHRPRTCHRVRDRSGASRTRQRREHRRRGDTLFGDLAQETSRGSAVMSSNPLSSEQIADLVRCACPEVDVVACAPFSGEHQNVNYDLRLSGPPGQAMLKVYTNPRARGLLVAHADIRDRRPGSTCALP